MSQEPWFRYDGRGCENGDVYYSCTSFPVLRQTRKGVWLDFYGKEKFVLLEARKRFAYPTKELAWNSFLRRKSIQIRILRSQLEHVERLYETAKEKGPDGLPEYQISDFVF